MEGIWMTVPDSALVLVAILPQPRDLEIARLLGWYRIPYKSAPKTINVDYIAFYQTGKFRDDQKWKINHYAEVRGHELVTRAELMRDEPDHPRADDMYFKLQIGPLKRLPQPIPSIRWRRITFFYTTGEYLNNATEINDLMVGSEERELLWKSLRERGLSAEKQYRPAPKAPEVDLAILCQLGTLGVTIGDEDTQTAKTDSDAGWTGLHLPERKVREAPDECIAEIYRMVDQLGGVVGEEQTK